MIEVNEAMRVEDMKEAIRVNPPHSWPGGWANWEVTKEAMRQLADEYLESIVNKEPVYDLQPNSKGIVICGGGRKYYPSTYANVRLLRELGCKLPIEVWHLGPEEMGPWMRRLLESLGDVHVIDARKVAQKHPIRILAGWELKIYAIKHSSFSKVLMLDADAFPRKDPTYILDSEQLRQCGALLWPDFSRLGKGTWEIFGIPYRDEQEIESGIVVVDKMVSMIPLDMALWYVEHSDYTFRHVYGDKECFHLGWRKAGYEYHLCEGARWHMVGYIHCDTNREDLFEHRIRDKLSIGRFKRIPGFVNEDLLEKYMIDLKELWDGMTWSNPCMTEEEKAVFDRIAGKRFMYRRVHHDERPMILEASSFISEGAADWERKWSINYVDGNVILTIGSFAEPICHLVEGKDGIWRGEWLKFEKMPIELVPMKK